jgi:thioredoxin-related protein
LKLNILFCLFIGLAMAFSEDSFSQKPVVVNHKTQSKLKWYTLEEAVSQNKIKKKKILIDLYTDWCGWCKVMDKNTFSNDHVIQYINKNFYPVKFNAETRESITFNNKTYNYVGGKGRGYNELALTLCGGRLSYPTVVFIDEDLNVIQPIQGYQEPKDFFKIIRYFGEDHYKQTPWQVYVQNYNKL